MRRIFSESEKDKPSIVRLKVHDENTGAISLLAITLAAYVDDNLTDVTHISQLPELIRERYALLNTMDPNPPTDWVDGVGRRIDKTTFWIFKD